MVVGAAAASERHYVISAVTTALDYARPSLRRPPNRWIGWPVALLSFGLSLHVAQSAIDSAYWLTGRPVWWMCGLQAAHIVRAFWAGPVYESFAVAGWVVCAKFGAGVPVARIGVLVGALCWLGSWLWMWW